MPVCDSAGEAFAALCLIGTPALYGEERLAELHGALQATATLLAADARKFNM